MGALCVAFTVVCEVPSESAVEVFCGNPVEAAHPTFEPAAIDVDVLDVVDAPSVLSGTQVERDHRSERRGD